MTKQPIQNFFTAPTPLSNGRSIEPLPTAQVEWKKRLTGMSERTLHPLTNSWITGGNVAGKKAENMNYVGGIHQYELHLRAMMDGWKGFAIEGGQQAGESRL